MALAGALAISAASAQARTKLVTLPGRDTMVVNMEHPSHSLLMEERDITLQQGTNFVDFSWQGVAIDPSSILLELMSNPGDGADATKIIAVAFPPNEQALTWQIFAPGARTEKIRVSYLLNGVGRHDTYEMTVDAAEASARLQHFLEVRNGSGEDLEDAAIRVAMSEDWRRSIDSGEVRRFLATNASPLPIRKVFETRPQPASDRGEDGEIISMLYEFDNTAEAALGGYKLPFGKARVFAQDPDGSTLFIGEDFVKETPTGEDATIKLGTVKDVVLKRRILSDRQENQRRNSGNRVVLYDRVVHLRYEVENFKDKAATVRVVEMLPPDAVLVEVDTQGVTTERKSAMELELVLSLEPRPDGADVPKREINLVYKVPDVLN
jgi:hypothetical protein